MMKILNVTLAMLVTGFSALPCASAAEPSCVDDGIKKLSARLKEQVQRNTAEFKASPAASFEGLDASGLNSNSYRTRQDQYTSRVHREMEAAIRSFYASKGEAGAIASDVFGDPNVRSSLRIIGRPKGDPSAKATDQQKCNSDCQELGINTRQLYVMDGNARDAMNKLSAFKLASVGDTTVEYCVGRQCANPKTREKVSTNNPPPMKSEVPYLVREEISDAAFWVPNFDNTYVYQVSEVDICGKTSYIVTGLLTESDESFDESSLYAVVTEANGKTLVYGNLQGVERQSGGAVHGIFGGFRKEAIESVASMYNRQAKALGSRDVVDNSGRIKGSTSPVYQPLASGSSGRSSKAVR